MKHVKCGKHIHNIHKKVELDSGRYIEEYIEEHNSKILASTVDIVKIAAKIKCNATESEKISLKILRLVLPYCKL